MFREPTHQEIMAGKSETNPHEQLRYKKNQLIMANLGPEYQARLQELKEKSKELNNLVEKLFKSASLPFSTKKGRARILRINFMLRPEQFGTGLSPEKKVEAGRFQSSPDELNFCIHINKHGEYDTMRCLFHRDLYFVANSIGYEMDPNTKPQPDSFGGPIDVNNLEPLADLLVERIRNNSINKALNNVIEPENLEKLQNYLQKSNDLFGNFPVSLHEKILKEMFRSQFEKLFQETTLKDKTTLETFQQKMQELINQISEFDVDCYRYRKSKKVFDLITKATINSLKKDFTTRFKKEIFNRK